MYNEILPKKTTKPLDLFSFFDIIYAMKGYYQRLQDGKKKIEYRIGSSFTFPAHFHNTIEIFIVYSGEYAVSSNGKAYTLHGGDIIFFDSYDIHAYSEPTSPNSKGLVLIIPTWVLSSFCERKTGKRIINPIISDTCLCEKVYSLAKTFIVEEEQNQTVRASATALIVDLIEQHLSFSTATERDETAFMQNLLTYLNDNFKGDTSLSTLSKQFGYTPEHISRTFHAYLNSGLPDYVNKLRLEYVENALKKNKQRKITDLLFEAGFNSIQTYYRAKHKLSAHNA